MYHISKDLRAQKSARKIGEGFLACLEHKNIEEIAVTDIQRASCVGRATFYRLFDNISDVLSYLCDNIFERVGSNFKRMNKHSPRESTLAFIEEWMSNKVLLSAIVDGNRMGVLYNAHLKYLKVNAHYFFPAQTISPEQMTYLMATMTACTSACLFAWLKNGGCENAEQLQTRLKNCFDTLHCVFE